jgi:starch phosphorylase
MERVKRMCVFTTHTPVPAGHDQFSPGVVERVLTADRLEALRASKCCNAVLNMTFVGLHLSHFVNGVTKRHSEGSRSMFPGYPINAITNGVHSATWTALVCQRLYDCYIPDWRQDSFSLRYALGVSLDDIRQAHQEVNQRLVTEVNRQVNSGFDHNLFTLGLLAVPPHTSA